MKKNSTRIVAFALKVLALTVCLVLVSGIGATLLPASVTGGGGGDDSSRPAGAPAGPDLGLVLAIFLLQVLALAFPIARSRWHGWRLTGAIFLVYFGTVTFQSQVESLVYLGGEMPAGMTTGLFAMGLFVAAAFSPIAVITLGAWRAPAETAPAATPAFDAGTWGWRVLAAGALFLALYYLFGYYIAWQDPALRAYYGGTDPGSFLAQMKSVVTATPWMLPLQFARGLIWVALGLLVIRSMKGPWWQAGLATALLFAVPSLYLLFPNPVMPDFPRLTHLVETLPYQFLFGFFLAWFFRPRTLEAMRDATFVEA